MTGDPEPMADPAAEVVAVGRVGRAHGVRGDVFVEPWTDAPEERFADGALVYAGERERRSGSRETGGPRAAGP